VQKKKISTYIDLSNGEDSGDSEVETTPNGKFDWVI
jgi:hypothetical protein